MTPSEPRPAPGRKNAAQRKADIDAGRLGDKVGGFDPAAAPLGTDAEAGGAAANESGMAETVAPEPQGRPNSATANAATPELQPDAAMRRGLGLTPILLGVAAAVVLAVILLGVL